MDAEHDGAERGETISVYSQGKARTDCHGETERYSVVHIFTATVAVEDTLTHCEEERVRGEVARENDICASSMLHLHRMRRYHTPEVHV